MELHGTSCALTWGNEIRIALSPIFICTSARGVPMFSPSPPPALCRRGCTVPGEGWSPAETEHSGEAPRRRRSPLWWRVRSASPLAAARIGTRITRGDRRQSRDVAWRCSARVVLQRCPSFTMVNYETAAPGPPRRQRLVLRRRRRHRPRRRYAATTGPVSLLRRNRRWQECIAVPVTTTTVAPKVAPVTRATRRRQQTVSGVRPRGTPPPLREGAPARRSRSGPC